MSGLRYLLNDLYGRYHLPIMVVENGFGAADKLGANRAFFLPYLMGERSPINDTNARGTFVGLSMDTTRSDVVQSVLEGVAMVGCGAYKSVEDCADALIKTKATVASDPEIAARYDAQYQKLRTIYPALEGVFSDGHDEVRA